MSHITKINDYNITDLITNTDREIDENDDDFQHILECIEQTFRSSNHSLTLAGSQDIEINTESSGIENECYKDKRYEERNLCIEPRSFNHKNHSHLRLDRSDMLRATKKGRYQEIFPQVLFKLLEKSNLSGYSHIISWLPHGHTFKIHNKKLFEEYVLNEYFNSTFESFKRQLYIYGFKKIGKRSTDSGAYYHAQFISGQQDMCSRIDKWKKKESKFTTINPNFDNVPTTLHNLDKCLFLG